MSASATQGGHNNDTVPNTGYKKYIPVLYHLWLVVMSLERGANDLHMIPVMPLPPRHLLLQQNPEWFTFLVIWHRTGHASQM